MTKRCTFCKGHHGDICPKMQSMVTKAKPVDNSGDNVDKSGTVRQMGWKADFNPMEGKEKR